MSGFATTRCPSGLRPTSSWPSTIGGVRRRLRPRNAAISEPQMPATLTAISHSPSARRGWGSSRNNICRGPAYTKARITILSSKLGCGSHRSSFSWSTEMVKPFAVSAQNAIPLIHRKLLDVIRHDIDHFCIICRKRTHRPVRTDHQSLRAKRVENHIEIGAKIIPLPVSPSRLRHHARELAADIRQRRQLPQVRIPRRDLPFRDRRLGNVIDHERLQRKLRNQLGRSTQMPRMNQHVIGQAKIRQWRNAAPKLRPQHDRVVGLILHHVPHYHKLVMFSKSLKLRRQLRRAQVHPAHHPLDEIVALRKFQQPARLLQALPRLYRHAPIKTSSRQQWLQFVRQKVVFQSRHFVVHPAVLCGIVFPKMLMSVNSHHAVRNVLWPSNFALRLASIHKQPRSQLYCSYAYTMLVPDPGHLCELSSLQLPRS